MPLAAKFLPPARLVTLLPLQSSLLCKVLVQRAPLLKTKWGQGAPFNSKCPSNGKQTAVAGCVPVALAQVLNYYHQDRKGEGSLYYAHLDSETEYDIDYSSTTYDWKNMLNEYDANASKVQKDAVGKLILECGIASKAKYGYTETGATIPFTTMSVCSYLVNILIVGICL